MALRQLGVRIPGDLFDRVEAGRGDVPRSTFVSRALEAALNTGRGGAGPAPPVGRTPRSASPRSPRGELEQRK